MADDRIRELEIMIRLIDIEIILARRRERRQEQANALNFEGFLMHYQVRPSNYLFQLFLTMLGRPEENSS